MPATLRTSKIHLTKGSSRKQYLHSCNNAEQLLTKRKVDSQFRYIMNLEKAVDIEVH